jgi:two-component system phosphate regulon sensor histidine kinase PhoR
MIFTPLRRKLALLYMGLIAAALALAGVLLLGHLSALFVESVSRDLAVRTTMAAKMVAREWPAEPVDHAAGDALAREISRVASARATLIALDGSVLAESHQASATMANHANRPEFQAALAGEAGFSIRYSDTTGDRLLYTAVKLPAGFGNTARPAMVVRLAVSLEWIYERIAAIRMALLWGLGTALALAAVAGLWSGSILLTRPLARIVSGARRFAAGDLTQPLELHTGDEWEALADSLNDMASTLASRIADLSEQRGQVRTILEGLPDGVLLLSPDLRLRAANRRAREWLRLPAASVDTSLGRSPELLQFARQAVLRPGPHRGEVVLRGPVSAVIGLRSAWLGEPRRSDLLVVMQDVTQMRRLETARRDLVANVSHELKTPIGAIRALAESIAADPEEEPAVRADFLDRIVKESERLSALVEEMLYLSRLESEVDRLRVRRADLGEIAALAAGSLAPLAQAKSIDLRLERQGETPLDCDPDLVERAVRALIDNAVKFSPAGTKVLVRVTGAADRAELRVIDEGPGIPAESLERVFERFYKGEQSRSGAGSGLGLAIVKHVVSRHGGQLIVQSALGRGSTLGFTLPVEQGQEQGKF